MSYRFYGGVHPSGFKTLTNDRPVKKTFIPKKVVLPLSQHTGVPAEPVVGLGEMVKVGQLIAKQSGFISASLHASIGGKVSAIAYSPTPTHPRALSIKIEASDNENQEFQGQFRTDISAFSKDELIAAIRDAGIVGLGGAAFPTYVKLSPPKGKTIDTVIVNGAECEPYLTCDHRIMVEKSKEVLKGLEIITKILGAKEAYIAIEDNKLSAAYAMEQALKAFSFQLSASSVKIIILKTKYPQGAEKQIIKAVVNRTVPAGGLPMDVGCVVQSVGTVFAIYEAIYLGKPLIERVVTLTGSAIKEPMNISVKIGTLISDLVSAAGGLKCEAAKVIAGGPMMGISQYMFDVPLLKGTSGVLFISDEDCREEPESVCIRCGACISACPMELVPTQLMYMVKNENFAEARDKGVANCYECGACAYDCPAKIPLVDYMKFGKAKI